MKRNKALAAALAFGVAAAVTSTDASAQNADGFSIDRFRPAERGSDWFALDSLDMRGHLRPSFGIVSHYSGRSFAVYSADDQVRFSPLASQLVLHPGGVIRLWDTLRLGLDLPIAALQTGTSGTFNGVPVRGADKAGVGDLRASIDLRLLGTYGDPLTVTLGAQLFLPTGVRSLYLGDERVRVLPRLQAAGIAGMFQYSAYFGALARGASDTLGEKFGTDLVGGAAAGLRLADGRVVIGPELFGGTTVTGAAGSRSQTPLELLLGAHVNVTNEVRLGAGAAVGLTRAIGVPVARGLFALEWTPEFKEVPKDRDGDGILDDADACPDVRGVRSDDPTKNGCPLPPPPPDRDHDGIIDAEDACPDVPGVRTDDPKTNGCPPDRDHDGIIDAEDACPDVPGVRTDDPKTNGCPPDRDKDGILDSEDACPDEPGIRSANPRFNGCPPDKDKDQILNDDDACPDEPGKPHVDPKKNGCPTARVDAKQIIILDQVKFVTNSSKIDPGKDSEEILDAVFKIMKDYPNIKKVRIEGHTDSRGSAQLNTKLSADRAASVIAWLVKHGIEKERLAGEGFGPKRPLDDNKTEEGRRINRRVEFHIVEDTKAPPAPAGGVTPGSAGTPGAPATPGAPTAPAAPVAPAAPAASGAPATPATPAASGAPTTPGAPATPKPVPAPAPKP